MAKHRSSLLEKRKERTKKFKKGLDRADIVRDVRFAYEQMKDFFVIALYLWIVFSLLVMLKSVVLAEQHIPFTHHGFAIINALALAKVMLTAKDLHLGERFDDAPLIYATL